MLRRLARRVAIFLAFAWIPVQLAYDAVGPLTAGPNRAEQLDGQHGVPAELAWVAVFGAAFVLGGIALIAWYTFHGDRWGREDLPRR